MTEKEITEQAITFGSLLRIEEWIDLKKFLLTSLAPDDRSKFSVRDPKTKKQRLNKFEERLLDNYYSQTGQRLIKER
jgi:hypothetical protein